MNIQFPPMQTTLTEAESAQLEAIIADIDAEHGPIADLDRPKHLGNFVWKFNNVPLGLFVGIMNASDGSLMRKFLRLSFGCRD